MSLPFSLSLTLSERRGEATWESWRLWFRFSLGLAAHSATYPLLCQCHGYYAVFVGGSSFFSLFLPPLNLCDMISDTKPSPSQSLRQPLFGVARRCPC